MAGYLYHVFRVRGTCIESLGEFEGPDDGDQAIDKAVEHEIRRLPIDRCSGRYFAAPVHQLIWRDWHVSYEKRVVT